MPVSSVAQTGRLLPALVRPVAGSMVVDAEEVAAAVELVAADAACEVDILPVMTTSCTGFA
jgi:hypothetical protein